MKPMGLTQAALAEAMGVQRKHVNELCNERRAVTAATALIPVFVHLALGLMLGLGFIFVREHLDDSVKHADEVEAQFGVPLLGIIPQVKKSKLASAALAGLDCASPNPTAFELISFSFARTNTTRSPARSTRSVRKPAPSQTSDAIHDRHHLDRASPGVAARSHSPLASAATANTLPALYL